MADITNHQNMPIESRNTGRSKFPPETILALADLGRVLQSIHDRLTAEGFVIIEDKIYKRDEEGNLKEQPYTSKRPSRNS